MCVCKDHVGTAWSVVGTEGCVPRSWFLVVVGIGSIGARYVVSSCAFMNVRHVRLVEVLVEGDAQRRHHFVAVCCGGGQVAHVSD